MISLVDVYHVVTATVPLYVAMILAYVSVRWWKLFTPEQCSGINKFVAKFSIPLLSFQILSENNPYKMNLKLILSDFVQKLLAFLVLTVVTRVRSKGGLNFIITGLSVSILPNTLILGIPLLKAMYGDEAAKMLAQIVALQSLIWYNLLLFMYEFNAAKSAASVSPSLEATEELENPQELQQPKEEVEDGISRTSTVPLKIKTGVILLTVGKKLMENPNTHATAIGLVWACIKYKWKVDLPEIAGQSIKILADGGLGMAMFSLGLFMASRPSIIACGTRMAIISMGFKFIGGPFLMAAASLAIGLRHTQLRVAIVQAALPQGIVPFVFAKEYNVHPDILSTGVIFGMLVALPIALMYFFLLAL
ncbi:auxin efflux carrier component 8 isoform X2 [Cannabis sativa]|uniref:Auxin efflux carrier component n=1 Tax=Cannabis sativa TaxID=3483 RepID=A0A803QM60_CANSA|nr:auxin efflux carrier component 8 isoform X2 [Cannabis sativa]